MRTFLIRPSSSSGIERMRVPTTPNIKPNHYIVVGATCMIAESMMTNMIILVLKRAHVGPWGAPSTLNAYVASKLPIIVQIPDTVPSKRYFHSKLSGFKLQYTIAIIQKTKPHAKL